MTDALANVDFSGALEAKLPTNLQALASPIAGSRAGLRRARRRRTFSPGRASRTRSSKLAVARAGAVRQGPARRHEGGGHVERQRRPRHPAARPEARRPVRVRQQPRGPGPAGRRRRSRSSRPTTWRRPRRSPTGSSRSRTSSGSSRSPAWVAAIWLARGRRRQEVRSLGIGLVAVGMLVLLARWLAGKYFVDQHRRQRFGAPGGQQRVADHHAVTRRCRLGRARRRHPRRGRRLARRARRPRHGGPGRARSVTAAAGRSPGARSSSRWCCSSGSSRSRCSGRRSCSSSLAAIGFVIFRRQLARGVAAPAPSRRRAEAPPPAPPATAARLSRSAAAVVAAAVEHDLVGAHAVVEPARRALERLLEAGIGERLDPAAVVADEVVVVLAVDV